MLRVTTDADASAVDMAHALDVNSLPCLYLSKTVASGETT